MPRHMRVMVVDARAVLERLRRGNHLLKDEKLARLSPQEEKILGLVAEGKTNAEIGAQIFLAEQMSRGSPSTAEDPPPFQPGKTEAAI